MKMKRLAIPEVSNKKAVWVEEEKPLSFPFVCLERKSLSCARLYVTPMDCIVHRILQARILEWIANPFSRGSFQPRIAILRVSLNYLVSGRSMALVLAWVQRSWRLPAV